MSPAYLFLGGPMNGRVQAVHGDAGRHVRVDVTPGTLTYCRRELRLFGRTFDVYVWDQLSPEDVETEAWTQIITRHVRETAFSQHDVNVSVDFSELLRPNSTRGFPW